MKEQWVPAPIPPPFHLGVINFIIDCDRKMAFTLGETFKEKLCVVCVCVCVCVCAQYIRVTLEYELRTAANEPSSQPSPSFSFGRRPTSHPPLELVVQSPFSLFFIPLPFTINTNTHTHTHTHTYSARAIIDGKAIYLFKAPFPHSYRVGPLPGTSKCWHFLTVYYLWISL